TAEADLKAWNKMMDLLEDDDDVQEVYHNFEDSER
ncbi:MAG: YebC/PmpR family DNA-binding transcriptional regulator, partial [Clostridiales bacterium]|nr:YebC/PmpR family DNA-binding transcriptional regulator [Clostridiales bacterium]